MSFVISFSYDKYKYLDAINLPSPYKSFQDLEYGSPTPSRIVRLQYNNNNNINRSADSLYMLLLPLRSSAYRHRNRTPTPEAVNSNTKNSPGSGPGSGSSAGSAGHSRNSSSGSNYHSPVSGGSSINSPGSSGHGSLKLTYTYNKRVPEALDLIGQYSERYVTGKFSPSGQTSVVHNQQLEQEWYADVTTVADRLHLLRELYRATQLIKKRKIAGKFDAGSFLPVVDVTAATNSNSPLHLTPFGLDDDETERQFNANLLQQEEDDSSSNSNTDNSLPLGRRTPRKRVQFLV